MFLDSRRRKVRGTIRVPTPPAIVGHTDITNFGAKQVGQGWATPGRSAQSIHAKVIFE